MIRGCRFWRQGQILIRETIDPTSIRETEVNSVIRGGAAQSELHPTDYWREAARFARRLTPVIQTVARCARKRRTKVFLDCALGKIYNAFQLKSSNCGFRASRCHHRVRLERSCLKMPTRGMEIELKAHLEIGSLDFLRRFLKLRVWNSKLRNLGLRVSFLMSNVS